MTLNSMEFHAAKLGHGILEQFMSVGTTNRSIEKRSSCVLYSVLWETTLSEMWDSSLFMDKFDLTGRPAQFHWHIFRPHSAPNQGREIQTFLGSTEPCDLRGRIIFMSVFNDIEFRKPCNDQTCLDAKEVTEYARVFQVNQWCFCGPGQESVWYHTSSDHPAGQTSRRMGSRRQENDTEI